jgi:hypothetical protein
MPIASCYDSDPRIGNPTFAHGDPECDHTPPDGHGTSPGDSDSRNVD